MCPDARSRARIGLGRALLVAFLSAACQHPTSSAVMPIDEAKRVAASFAAAPFVPPPHTIGDVTDILDHPQPPDLKLDARRQADAVPPAGADAGTLAEFYFTRGLAARGLGRAGQEIGDLTSALRYARSGFAPIHVILYELGSAEMKAGGYSRAVDYVSESIAAAPAGDPAGLIAKHATLAVMQATFGDLESSQAALARARVFPKLHKWSGERTEVVSTRRALVANAEGTVRAAMGHEAEAEALFRLALADPAGDPFHARHTPLDERHASLAWSLIRQGRLVEAEHEARQAVLIALARHGRYSSQTAWMLRGLVEVLLEQGRYVEAEQLARAVVDIYETIQATSDSLFFAFAREQLARALAGQRRDREALAVYEVLLVGLRGDARSLDQRFGGMVGYAVVLRRTGNVDRAVTLLESELPKSRGLVGESRGAIGGYLAQSYAIRGDTARALTEFRRAMPPLLARQAEVDEYATTPRAADQRLIDFIGTYVGVLSDIAGTPLERESNLDAAAEAFRLADVARGRSVHRALAAGSARVAARSPALADLLRREQDTKQQLGALHGTLANQLSQVTDGQGSKAIADLRTQIEALRRARATLSTQIERDFPAYTDITNPKPVTAEQARAMLRPGEALVATLVSRERTFVWAIPHQGPVAFAFASIGSEQMAQTVTTLRRALEPRAKTLGDIPHFDVALAHRVYTAVFEPVRPAWQDARNLFVVADGPLSRLPAAVLPTQATGFPPESGTIFSNYRQVPWLARTHAVTMLPSVASLITVRSLPPGDRGRRAFAGFGDPYFSKEQAALAESGVRPPRVRATFETRTTPISLRQASTAFDTRQLANLARLPDTADEIHALARTMNADASRDVFLGVRANEKAVKTLPLDSYRVIAFATHGLIPGDLHGLTQPALALSAPEVAGVDGDGLLTMGEILALRLDADWIVLSACNTGGGESGGAEAVSGLGRAFFYAGARALLVSNWPVETTSARVLTTQLFQRSPSVSRAEALQATLTWMIDSAEFVDDESGKVVFSYAHPIFWAPFTLVGDGGHARVLART